MKHFMILRHYLFTPLILLGWLVMTANLAWAQPIKVEVVKTDGKYQLLRGGQPYHIKGAGLANGDLESLVAHGGNSIRTWSTVEENDGTLKLLDAAHELGVTVSLCLYTGVERHGFDYYDDDAVARQFEEIRERVLRYKDHPALLTWIIGNELNFDYKNPRVYDAVNDISKMIHELDPNHPTTTTIAGFNDILLEIIAERAPDLDFISFQVYAQLYVLPEFIEDIDYSAPFFVTEWGAIGHWEVPKTEWGAPIEQDSTEKAQTYQRGYRKILEPLGDQLIGNYVFLWGQKQEKTPTWYGLFTENGEATEAIDVLHEIWTGNTPDNRAPRIESVRLNGKAKHKNIRLKRGKAYKIEAKISDPDGDTLEYLWEVKRESEATQVGGDYEEAIASLDAGIAETGNPKTRLTAPQEAGAYRLFVYARDGQGHAAHANIPFYVDE
ncbi:MAG: glycoside hydrolase family 2 TIM barrel-domain containing protein [Lysobacterales bacterium]